ncbi:MAG TPA: ferric reductase-like transmembrane domain-containing protein [Gaiellaceae bacterium]|nr:ferric reductase-like transmembrane domain-containing protein [Gaiellaceae bacterium]
MTDPTFWLEARASGLLAYLLLTASVLAGLLLKSKPFGNEPRPASVTDAHRFLALLAIAATAVHGLTLVLDRSITITLSDLLVPGRIPYRPLATGVGVVAAELMAAVYVSFSQRKRIGAKNWRRLHWATYAVFAAMVVHGAASGTDTKEAWVRALYAVTVGLVAAATFWRAVVPPRRPARVARASA